MKKKEYIKTFEGPFPQLWEIYCKHLEVFKIKEAVINTQKKKKLTLYFD